MKLPAEIIANSRLDRRKFILGATFASAAGLAAWRRPGKLEAIIPREIGSWRLTTNDGLVVPPRDQLSDALYSQLLTRVYFDGSNPPVMLLVAQSAGQSGILQVHRPEVCYPAGGYTVSPVTRYDVDLGGRSLATNSLLATSDSVFEHILYWTRIGEDLPMSWRAQRMAVAVQNLQGLIPDAILVRVSTRRPDGDGARKVLGGFVRDLVASISAPERKILIA